MLKYFNLFTRLNIEKAFRFIKSNGTVAFLKKAKSKLYAIGGGVLDQNQTMPQTVNEDNSSGGSIWDKSSEQYKKNNFKVYWELLPEVSRYQFKSMTGREDLDYLTYTIDFIRENIGSRDLRALSIGCSEGNPGPEMSFFRTGLFRKIEVMDIAGGLLEKQRRIASDAGLNGVEYIRQDFNSAILEKNAYDMIWAIGTVHHISRLESLFEQINYALKDHGIFMMREYVGPNYLQFTDFQLAITNEILSVLPEKYKKGYDGMVKTATERPDIDQLKLIDPSESIRSEDILNAVKRSLEIIKVAYTGGTILQPLLNGIASNFETDEDAETVLKLIILFERVLVQNGVIPSDYVFCMARKGHHGTGA